MAWQRPRPKWLFYGGPRGQPVGTNSKSDETFDTPPAWSGEIVLAFTGELVPGEGELGRSNHRSVQWMSGGLPNWWAAHRWRSGDLEVGGIGFTAPSPSRSGRISRENGLWEHWLWEQSGVSGNAFPHGASDIRIVPPPSSPAATRPVPLRPARHPGVRLAGRTRGTLERLHRP